MANFKQGFSFDQGSLGRNLALMDHRMQDAMDTVIREHAYQGEEVMKVKAPWTDNTGMARQTLWADADTSRDDQKSITMGHGVRYGIFLEKSNGGRFQIVIPVVVETTRAIMRSFEHLFAQLETHTTPAVTAISPSIGTRPGTSQGATEHFQHAKGEAKKHARRFEAVAKQAFGVGRRAFSGITKRTKRTRRG